MSVELRPEFNPPVRGLVFQAEGKALADQLRRIHSFSTKRGLAPITDFLDNRDVNEDGVVDEEEHGPRSDWHAPAAGLQAVQALTAAMQADPKASQRWNKEDPDGLETLLADLEELARCLEAAAAQGAQFRLDLS